MSDHAERPGVSRRSLVLGTGIGALTGIGLGALGATLISQRDNGDTSTPVSVNASGPTQAGVTRPMTPQRHSLVVVADADRSSQTGALPRLGEAILDLTTQPDPALLPDGSGDLTVLVGLGKHAFEALPGGAAHAGIADLPLFAGDELLPDERLGGDLLLSLSASDSAALEPALEKLRAQVPGFRLRWSQFGFRGPGEDGIARNPFGFHDGVIVPRGDAELDEDVWITEGPLTGATICVIRRFALDTAAFGAHPIDEQSAMIGRDKITGAPLSGGELLDEVDIVAKHPDGEFVVASDSHVRAAHPSFTGSGLMLRRSYSYLDRSENGEIEHGLLFTAFQNDVRTFVRTQQRLDDVDVLMQYARATATAAFVILPGFDEQHSLGSTLI